MNEVTTYVGIDAHKKDLVVAMLMGTATTPVAWQLANETCGRAAVSTIDEVREFRRDLKRGRRRA